MNEQTSTDAICNMGRSCAGEDAHQITQRHLVDLWVPDAFVLLGLLLPVPRVLVGILARKCSFLQGQ